MSKRRRLILASTLVLAMGASLVGAFADPVPVPAIPPYPETPVPLPVTLKPIPTPPTINAPNPDTTLAMLQAQVELMAAAVGQTPDELLASVLEMEVPTGETLTMTASELLARLADTTVFDATSNGFLGTTEIAIGNISHAFNVTLPKPASDWVPRCLNGGVSPCTEAPSPNLADLPSYRKTTSDWLPAPAAQSVLGTSILLPLANALTPVPPMTGTPVTGDIPAQQCDPVDGTTCVPVSNLIKPNLLLASVPSSKLVNIQGSGWNDGTKRGTHNGGTGLLNGSNLDTGYRLVSPGEPVTSTDPWPVWMPLFTSASALADDAIDFLGFSTSAVATTKSCANVTGGVKQFQVIDGVEYVQWPAQSCNSRSSMSGFGIAVYGKSPVNFHDDLAPLWTPAPSAIAAVGNAAAAIVATLTPSVPSQSVLLAYALAWAAWPPAAPAPPATPPLPETPEGVPGPDDLPPVPEGAPGSDDLPPLPEGLPDLPGLPEDLPGLPEDLPGLPPDLPGPDDLPPLPAVPASSTVVLPALVENVARTGLLKL